MIFNFPRRTYEKITAESICSLLNLLYFLFEHFFPMSSLPRPNLLLKTFVLLKLLFLLGFLYCKFCRAIGNATNLAKHPQNVNEKQLFYKRLLVVKLASNNNVSYTFQFSNVLRVGIYVLKVRNLRDYYCTPVKLSTK